VSTFATATIACGCGRTQDVQVADSLQITRVPAVRQAILDGSFHRFPCPGCGRMLLVDKLLAYTDFGRRHWILVFPRALLGERQELLDRADDSYRATMIERCAPVVRGWSEGMFRRTVFGLPALREKLIGLDLGLDDRVIELMKLGLAARLGLEPGDFLHLEGVGEGRLRFLCAAAGDAAVRTVELPAAGYRALACHGDDLAPMAAAVIDRSFVDWRVGLGGEPDSAAPPDGL
jgi:CpXC motif protein